MAIDEIPLFIIAAVMAAPTLSTVIVAHDSLADLRRSLPPLIAQLRDGDQLIVVDSGSSDGLSEALAALAPNAIAVDAGANVGFAAGANIGAAAATGELLVLLNPDAVVEPGWADAIRSPWGGRWAAWMGLVTMGGGTVINTSGGVLHFTGLGWAGQAGRPVTEAPAGEQPVAFLSGACLAIPSESWRELGGFPAQYFMYCEDVDLSLRIRARGGELAVVPAARAVHDYDFDKGDFKWRMLERNRWATIVRNYPAPLLTLLAPALLATELAIWAAAVQGGWWRMKALATADLVRSFPRLLSERRALRRDRTVDAAVFAQGLTAELDSPFLGATAANPAVRAVLRTYWATVRSLLSVFRSRSA